MFILYLYTNEIKSTINESSVELNETKYNFRPFSVLLIPINKINAKSNQKNCRILRDIYDNCLAVVKLFEPPAGAGGDNYARAAVGKIESLEFMTLTIISSHESSVFNR